MANNQKDFEIIYKQIRREIIEASFKAKACHIGSALSCVEIIVDLYYRRMKPEDIFVFSKASGVATLYAVLAKRGYFPKERVARYLKKYPLANRKVPGVTVDSGSLGHGLPQACGLALAYPQKTIWCLMSDGEMQEGTTWEALLFKRQHKLDNLKIIVDHNGWQACGKIEDILDIPWDFISSYDVEVIETIKGRGVSFMRDNNEWHYFNLTKELRDKALKELK